MPRCTTVAAFLLLPAGILGARPVGRVNDREGVAANDWTLRPVGQLFAVGESPQGAQLSPDGQLLAVANCGWGKQSLQVFRTSDRKLLLDVPIPYPKAIFHGLCFAADSRTLYASGGPTDVLRVVDLTAAQPGFRELSLRSTPVEPSVENPEEFAGRVTLPDLGNAKSLLYPIGLQRHPGSGQVWVAEALGSAVAVVDPVAGKVLRRTPVGAYPYEIAFADRGRKAYVSLWGAGQVAVLDGTSGQGRRRISVGQHPCALVVDEPGQRLYVANAHSDSVSVIDTATDEVIASIDLAPYAAAPLGTQPNALALAADGRYLLVADGGNNCFDVVEVNRYRQAFRVLGRVPTGWYPSGLQITRGNQVFVVSAKGLGSQQNAYPTRRYIGAFHIGLGQALPLPLGATLATYNQQVQQYTHSASAGAPRLPQGDWSGSPIPRRLGDPSPIQYVIYCIKENRTYDQVFGDLPQGNGDPKLCLYGRRLTPNQHRLAEQYALLDNFYCNGSVSVDGHPWAKAANVADAIEKTWPLGYSQRGPTLGGPVGNPAGGWIWERAAQQGLLAKTYGGGMGAGEDLKRVATILKDIGQWERDGGMPRLIVMHLPNNHTFGTATGKPTPAAMVAENDLAVGQLIEGLTKTRFWPQMAVFIVEDDAQDGPDHVDCHRSPALVISPWLRRGIVDSTHYDQCAVIRTIGLILGLPPLSQFDAAAVPLHNLFAATAQVTAYQAVVPEQRLDALNGVGAYGQQESDRMNWAEVDEAPWPALNRILWHTAKGLEEPYPTLHQTHRDLAVRAAEDESAEHD
ncbi:MAG: hypothetical protein IT204_21555 [Fimbriimonadaceae bacterium]|nr:hypothetical protein [Fimbriimonadaceae bacterium]